MSYLTTRYLWTYVTNTCYVWISTKISSTATLTVVPFLRPFGLKIDFGRFAHFASKFLRPNGLKNAFDDGCITTPILRRSCRFKDQYYSIQLVWSAYATWVGHIPSTHRDVGGVKSDASASVGVARRFWMKNHTSHKKHPHHDASHGNISHVINNINYSSMLPTPKFCAESIFEVGGAWISMDTEV